MSLEALAVAERQGAELRHIAGAGGLSPAVDAAVSVYLAKWRHLAGVDDWLAELEREHGPVPPEAVEWAVQVIERWEAGRR
jgi:hypothetical protein